MVEYEAVSSSANAKKNTRKSCWFGQKHFNIAYLDNFLWLNMKRFQAVLKEVGMHPKARKVANAEDPRHREIKRAEEHFRSDEKININKTVYPAPRLTEPSNNVCHAWPITTDFLNRVKFNVKKSKAVKTAKQPVPALKKLLVAPREVTTQNNNPEFLALFRFETVA